MLYKVPITFEIEKSVKWLVGQKCPVCEVGQEEWGTYISLLPLVSTSTLLDNLNYLSI